MADEPKKNALGWAGVAVVAIVTLGVVFLTVKAIGEYEEAKDVVAVLGAVISPLAGVGAAAFGIKQSADAKSETEKVKSEAGSLADRVRDVVTGGGQEVRAAGAAGGGGHPTLERIEADLRRLAR